MSSNEQHEANRSSWNEATKAHNSHKGDQATFFRTGGSTLFPEEIELLGDIRGKHLAHLQCNAGQDTLSIAGKLGAVVTGVDISDEAIDFARKLAAESGIPATFVRADVYDWFGQAAHTGQQFEAAFSSYGTVVWLSDLPRWGRGIASVLKPGGRFVLVDFHPVLTILNEEYKPDLDYMGGSATHFDYGVGDYVGGTGTIAEGEFQEGVQDFHNPHPAYEFSWGIADIVTALLDAGLRLITLREYPYVNGFRYLPDFKELPGRRFTVPDGMPILPMMYGIVAQKPTEAT
jgi:SAM-dependent methyltransferase